MILEHDIDCVAELNTVKNRSVTQLSQIVFTCAE